MKKILLFCMMFPLATVAQYYMPPPLYAPTIPSIRTNDYYIEYPVYPALWQVNQPQTGDTLLTIISPYGTRQDRFLENITLSFRNIYDNKVPLTLDNYFEHLNEEFITRDPSAVLLEAKKKKDRNGYPYQFVKYQVYYRGMKLIIEERCYIKHQTVYFLSFCYQYKGDSYHTWMGHQVMRSFYMMD